MKFSLWVEKNQSFCFGLFLEFTYKPSHTYTMHNCTTN